LTVLCATPGAPPNAENRIREEAKFASQFNADSTVQSSHEKYSSSVFQQLVFRLGYPASMQRAFWPIVTGREAGMRWTCWSRRTSDADAYAEVVWS
jgi:hypothetical protein